MFNHCVYFNLSSLTRRITKIWQDEFSLLGLSPSHGYLLSAMAANPDASQKDLSAIMDLDASTITRFVDALAAKKLIERTSAGKGARFTLTKDGLTLSKKIDGLMKSLFTDMQTTFGEGQFQTFIGHLQQAKQTLQEQRT